MMARDSPITSAPTPRAGMRPCGFFCRNSWLRCAETAAARLVATISYGSPLMFRAILVRKAAELRQKL